MVAPEKVEESYEGGRRTSERSTKIAGNRG